VPLDLTPLDLLALAAMVFCWQGYAVVFDRLLPRRAGLNQNLKAVRLAWMRRLLERENRITDAALVGQTMQSVAFFGSATLLVLAGVVGVIGSADSAWQLTREIRFFTKTSKEVFELKLFVLAGLFAFAFFQFTWALRQYNYLCAMIGAAPPSTASAEERERVAAPLAELMTLAVTSFNGGLRAHYFSVATLLWFVGPIAFMLGSLAVLVVLLRRQLFSRTAATVASEAALIER
jgi:uncharacterized membrane protein